MALFPERTAARARARCWWWHASRSLRPASRRVAGLVGYLGFVTAVDPPWSGPDGAAVEPPV